MRRLPIMAAAAFLTGLLMAPAVLSLLTYTVEFVRDVGWSSVLEVSPAYFSQFLTNLGWSPVLEVGPAYFSQVLTDVGWAFGLELIPQPKKDVEGALGFTASVSVGPAPFRAAFASHEMVGMLNLSVPDRYGILTVDDWWLGYDVRRAGLGVRTAGTDLPYRAEVSCRSPPCSLQVFLPFWVHGAEINATGGSGSYTVTRTGGGTLTTLTLEGDGPVNATVLWKVLFRFTAVDYRDWNRSATVTLRYADLLGTEATLDAGTVREVYLYPVNYFAVEPAGRIVFDPAGNRCDVRVNRTTPFMVLSHPADGTLCEIRAHYVLGTTLRDVALSPHLGGTFKVEGRLLDEEGYPVPGRRIHVMLEGNATRPAEAVTGGDGRFSAVVYVPPSSADRRLTVRFAGEPALLPSSKVLEIPGTGEGQARRIEVPASAYAFLAVLLFAMTAVIVLSFARASRRAQVIYRQRRVLR